MLRPKVIDLAKIAAWLLFANLALDMLNQLVDFFTGMKFLAPALFLVPWLLLAILIYWCFSVPGKYTLFKLYLVCTLIKWAVYIFIYGHIITQKRILIVPLLLIGLSEREDFLRYSQKSIASFKYILCFLFALTVIPFIGWYSVNPDPYRFSGIWDFPQNPGYYCVAFMILFLNKNIVVNLLIYLLVIYTGAKSAILAGTVVLLYSCRVSFMRSIASSKKTLLIPMGLGAIILLVAFVVYGGMDYFIESATFHYEKLFSEEITNDKFGAGRVYMSKLALDELKNFSAIDLMLGRSPTSLYDLYVGKENTGGWPHNDFVTVLYIYGIFGFAFYIYYVLIRPLKYPSTDYPWKNIALVLTVFLLMATNGFYQTRSSFLFLLCYAELYQRNRLCITNQKMRKVELWDP